MRMSRAVLGLALVKLVIHLATSTRYGLHGDELYYLACAERLDWGYVDIGPVVPWLVALTTSLIGDSAFAVRLPAAIAGAALILLTGRLAQRVGGGRTAQVLSALAVLIAPAVLRVHYMIQAPALEPLAWTGCILILVSILQGGSPRNWLWFGLVSGIGLLIKPTMLLFGAGVVVGLLLTSHRRQLATRWPWLGGMVALAVYAPHLLWQQAHGWPTLEFMSSIQGRVLESISAPEFLIGQLIYVHPFNAPIWLAGLSACLVSRRTIIAPIGWLYVFCLTALLFTHGKAYYLLPIYPGLLAVGAATLEPWLDARRLHRAIAYGAVSLGGLIFAPAAMGILSLENMESYARTITFGAMENSREVTDDLRRMHGWEELVDAMAEAHEGLSPEERSRSAIWTASYAQASAVAYYGSGRGLPPAVSGHMTYYLWGPPTEEPEVLITCGINEQSLRNLYGQVEVAAIAESEESMWKTLRIFVCREPTTPMAEFWPRAKGY